MSHSDRRSSGGVSSRLHQPDAKEKKPLSSKKQARQDAAYRRWDAAASAKLSGGNKSYGGDSSVEEQATRASAIVDLDMPDFFPQSFMSKRAVEKDRGPKPERKEEAAKGINKFLTGPIEDLISPALLPGTDEERAKRQAENLTIMRRELLQKTAVAE